MVTAVRSCRSFQRTIPAAQRLGEASHALGKFQQKLDSRVGQQRLSPERRALLRDMAELLRFEISELYGGALMLFGDGELF